MLNDPIVLEIRKHREVYASSLGNDLERIVTDLQSRQGQDGRMVVDRTSRETPHDDETRTYSTLKSATKPTRAPR